MKPLAADAWRAVWLLDSAFSWNMTALFLSIGYRERDCTDRSREWADSTTSRLNAQVRLHRPEKGGIIRREGTTWKACFSFCRSYWL